MTHIINFQDLLEKKETTNYEETKAKADALLAALPQEEAGLLVFAVFDHIKREVQMGLGVINMTDQVDGTPFFNDIDDIYMEANKHCYFCAGIGADPHEIEFDQNTRLCYICREKLMSFQRFLKRTGAVPKKYEGECYFCDKGVTDPVETPFTMSTPTCPICKLKLRSYRAALQENLEI